MTRLIFSSSPHIHTSASVTRIMLCVIIALMPSLICALYYFGWRVGAIVAVAVGVAVVTEWAINRFMLRRAPSVGNLSAVLTGLLLALNLPSSLPLWTVAMGSFFAIAVAKMAFGGLGCNIFNPALVGRVFLLISFPALMTTWPLPGGGFEADGATGATILGRLKLGENIDGMLSYTDMLLGHMGGSLGEVGAVAILVGFVFLLATGVITWHIPVAMVGTAAVFAWAVGEPVAVTVLSGGLLFGAVFMATDYVTSPMTRAGMLIYAVLIGVITVIIRVWGAYPEGVSFAILLGNGLTPLINRFVKPARFAERSVAR